MMKKLLKILPKEAKYIIPCIVLTGILVFVVSIRMKADYIGNSLGEMTGSSVGKVIGSFEALTDYREAYAEGKEEGLSAKDTIAEVANKVQELKRLEVLVASVKLKDEHLIGKEDSLDYAALYLLKGDAVFTVDFNETEIRKEGDILLLTIPEPEMELIIDQSKLEKVAEYQKFFWSGSAKDGFDAYLASMAKVAEETKETLVNYDTLMKAARESAEKQVEQLVNSVSVSEVEVKIEFKEKETGAQNTDLDSETEMNRESNSEVGTGVSDTKGGES
ncbi:MAG: DUF4230 domain-containing protein [Lachnospiraceae bacterium]|nr:DUF4230 domain-containing protein [Lachnospiraceae bacterium]